MATDGDHIVNVDDDETLAESIEAKLRTVSPVSENCCIFRVPEVLRRENKKVYEPDVVAIGPYHRKKESLQPMEDVKKWYLHGLLFRTNMRMLSLIKGIKEFETSARECYQVPIDVDDEENEFMEMLIIDGCFLIELFRKDADSDLRSTDDPVFNMACMDQHLYHDLLLLENQLPWFIIEKLFDLTMPNVQRNSTLDVPNDQTSSISTLDVPNDQTSSILSELVLDFFSDSIRFPSCHRVDGETLHILGLIKNVLVSSFPGPRQTRSGDTLHLTIPCVTRLLEAGIEFKKGSPGSINFENGIFIIPPLLIDETTGPLFRNLIAFEQCYRRCDHKFTSYAVLMDKLINTGKDVEYLVKKRIIDNWLSDEEASQFFNHLYNDTSVDFCYDQLFNSVNDYYGKKRHRWRATLVHQYSTAPWTIISLIAGIILLVLTFLQTVYSIKQS